MQKKTPSTDQSVSTMLCVVRMKYDQRDKCNFFRFIIVSYGKVIERKKLFSFVDKRNSYMYTHTVHWPLDEQILVVSNLFLVIIFFFFLLLYYF